MERFVTEFANHTERCIKNSLMSEEEKNKRIGEIYKAVSMRYRNLITADEAIMVIGNFQRKEEK